MDAILRAFSKDYYRVFHDEPTFASQLSIAQPQHVSYGKKLSWGGPVGDYVGFWEGPTKRYTTNLVQGSCSQVAMSIFVTVPN